MINQLPQALAEALERLSIDEQRPAEEVLQSMFAQYRSIKPDVKSSSDEEVINPAREAARAKLLAAGALVTQFDVPEGAVRLTVEERLRMGTLRPGARSSLDLINEDRGEW
jgi:hypothetical protein